MRRRLLAWVGVAGVAALCCVCIGLAQIPEQATSGPFAGGIPGFPGGPGGFMGGEVKLLDQFDKDGNKRLDAVERKAAREYVAKQAQAGGPGRGFRGGFMGGGPMGPPPFGRGAADKPAVPGPKLAPAQVKTYGQEPLYDLKTLRTLFLEFESADWEKELADFHKTDVEVPAKVTVDGKTYADVGVHFRGLTSYMMVPEGRKRSLNLSFDFVHPQQRLAGYRTLNLLNSIGDPTFLRTVLYLQIAQDYIPASLANYMRVVINGECWGIYVNVEQFNTDFVKARFGTAKGARWKVPGPGARSGLEYLGEDPKAYKQVYEIKSKDDTKSWADLIHLCKVLNQTPGDKLEKALEPLLDIHGTLKFLALDKALINNDGYWSRASDYSIYQDEKGRFHVVPHDINEGLREAEGFPGGFPGGPGFPPFGDGPVARIGAPELPAVSPPGREGRGGRGGVGAIGVNLDPFAGADDPGKALLNKLLAVPSLRTRYLGYIRDIAEKWLVWGRIEPLARQYQALIAADIKSDTRKLDTTEAFFQGVTEDTAEAGFHGPGGPPALSLKSFVEKRRTYLLNLPEVRNAQAR